ncbi:MAG: hypothetical protein HY606_07030 [Planctomycetes bacterium]|nr:hypothetical protein [Planctomycetota bacterium]
MNQCITASVTFKKGELIPNWFTYAGEQHKIDRILFRWKKKEGHETIFYFAVEADSTPYSLSFSTRNMSWYIEQEEACEQ